MTRPYQKPELLCYERPGLGYYSSSNANAECQADCVSSICTYVATLAGAPCDLCDCDNTRCRAGIWAPSDCWPTDCP